MREHGFKADSLLIKGARVIDPLSRLDAEWDLLLREGRIAELAPKHRIRGAAEETFDARGLVLAPGFIDMHVHLREPGQSQKETIATGTAAAAAGGFTSVCCMPNTSPVIDSQEWVRWLQQPERGARVNVFPIAAATMQSQGEALTDFPALKRAGAVGISDDGRPLLDGKLMRQALQLSSRLKLTVIQHAEDTRMTVSGSMHEGATSFRLGLRGMPGAAESAMVERDVKLAHSSGGHLHIAHLSTADALSFVRRAKRAKARVTCEVTPHHFTLTDQDIGDYDTNCKMNPPLRSAADREAILAGLADGSIDAIATDHAPHAAQEKQMEFERAPFGVTGLETALGLAISELHGKHQVPLIRIVELFTLGPARVLKLNGRGTLVPGNQADLTIFDPKRRWTFEAAASLSKSRNTPFDGWRLTGRLAMTMVSGRIVHYAL
ncbi:MAG: dihydroorotase [Acidobacteria bacterium]|nr:dihydroorotase [Acidobacteriota bacterium]